MELSLTFLYIDQSLEDAEQFKERIKGFPGLEPFDLEVVHKQSMKSALQWLSQTRPADLIICIDPSSPGIGQANVDKAIFALKQMADTDRVFAIPSSATSDELWTQLKRLLPREQILSKRDVYNNGGMALLAKAAIDSMAARNSDGRRQISIELAQIDGNSKLRDSEINAEINIIAMQIEAISKDLESILRRMEILDSTIFMSVPGTQVPPVVEQVRSNQMGIAAVMKDIAALDGDINSAVKLLNARIMEMQDKLISLIEATTRRVDELKDRQSANSVEIMVNREQFIMRIFLAFVGVGLAVLASIYGIPITEIINKLLN